MGCKFLPDSLGIHVIKVFPHYGLAHVTEYTFIENTIHKIIFYLAIPSNLHQFWAYRWVGGFPLSHGL